MTWNKKNQQFALSCALRPSTIDLAQYLLRRADKFKPTEVLLDLRDWNIEQGKHRTRGEYDRKTVKQAIAQLDEETFGWFTIVKSYTWAVHKVIVRPLEFALQNKSQSLGKAPKLKTGNPMFSDEHKQRLALQQQQDISKLDDLLTSVGLKYTQDNLLRIWRMAGKCWDDIETAIEYMLYSNSTSTDGVRKPKAFMMECLKCGWHKGFNLMYEGAVKLPYFATGKAIGDYVRDLMPDPEWCQT